jgi:predicted nuclease of predicted toxin-antitoxin system
MARFYSNENIALQVVLDLRLLGHDVLTSLEAGNANASVPDPEVLAFACARDRILLTHNRRHFLQLHLRRVESHRGILLCTFDANFGALANRIDAAITTVRPIGCPVEL